jgi:lactoylglutathione lyase
MTASHFRLLVTDFERTFRFYREVVGLPTTYPPDSSGPYGEFELGGEKYLGLFDRALMLDAVGRPPDSQRLPDDHALLCISVTDVDEEARRLRGLGADLVAPPADHEPWGSVRFTCATLKGISSSSTAHSALSTPPPRPT